MLFHAESLTSTCCVEIKQGWEFALSLFALSPFRSFALSLLLLFSEEQLAQNKRICHLLFLKELFALFKSGLCSFLKRKLKTGLISHFLALLRVGNLLFRSSLFCSRHLYKKSKKSAKQKSKKRAIRSFKMSEFFGQKTSNWYKNQRANSQP